MQENLSIEYINPLVERTKIDGMDMWCLFRCPMSQEKYATIVTLSIDTPDKQKQKPAKTKKTLNAIRFTFYKLVSEMFEKTFKVRGLNTVPNIIDKNLDFNAVPHGFSESEKRDGIIRAFLQLEDHFYWEENENRWISKKVFEKYLTIFAKMIAEVPVYSEYDLSVLSRMLVSIAKADGKVSYEERFFLSEFISPKLILPEDLISFPEPNKEELSLVSKGQVRETLLMIAWGAALTDRHLDKLELDKLTEYASWFEIDIDRANQLKRFAQLFIIEKAIDNYISCDVWDAFAYNEMVELANNIGLKSNDLDFSIKLRLSK